MQQSSGSAVYSGSDAGTSTSSGVRLPNAGLEAQITSFGREIFEAIGNEQPSTFNKNFWSGKMMEWAMTHPDFKLNLFRLVDVLPSLRRSERVTAHVAEYLGPSARDLHSLLGWAVSAEPKSLRGALTAFAVRLGVRQMAQQFIAGVDAAHALPKLRALRQRRLAFTVDLLGEYCVSEREAVAYLNRYLDALETLGEAKASLGSAGPLVPGNPGELSSTCVSVKLTALYSQCNVLNFDRSVDVLSERLALIARRARATGALLYVDAEDTANNPIIYATFKRVFSSAEFRDLPYPGIVVQAYAKNAPAIVDDLLQFARDRGAPIAIRLVKGAYHDAETIVSQQNGWENPLFESKRETDAAYERLSRTLLEHHEFVLPAFGSHNVRSLAHACCVADSLGLDERKFELQMLYGMAEPIARAFTKRGYLVRLYVPLGELLPGMGYLVRRLLENTSNESFLRHTFFDRDQVDALLASPQQGA